MDNAKNILKKCGLSITRPRLVILRIFLRTSNILSHHELMSVCDRKINRITAYRTLQALYEHHLLLKVPSSNGVTKYLYRGIQQPAPGSANHPEKKVHLICQDCGKIIDLKDFSLPALQLPNNFAASHIDLIINGRCTSCRKP
jgi:Fur family ferric uptake transcriptional regulator